MAKRKGVKIYIHGKNFIKSEVISIIFLLLLESND